MTAESLPLDLLSQERRERREEREEPDSTEQSYSWHQPGPGPANN